MMTPQQALAFLREQIESNDPIRGCHIGPKQVFVIAQQAIQIIEKAIDEHIDNQQANCTKHSNETGD